jgi:hypothetical protein
MISLIRIALIMLIIYLIQRAFTGKSSVDESSKNIKINKTRENKKSKVPGEIGDYIDYEEVDK